MKNSKCPFCWLVFLVLIGCRPGNDPQSRLEKPNILLLIADDLGYGDLGCYGGASATPNLDQLAADGLLFTGFYAAAPNCSPSRAGLMTGISPAKLGMYNYRPPNHPIHLRDSVVTIAEVLKKEGYQTAHIGKWHLGCLPQDSALQHPQPRDQGFDYSFGTENNAQPSHLNPVNFVRNGERLGVQEGYSCRILAEEAMQWLTNERQQENPFFLYLAFHEPHRKVASPPELVAKYGEYPPADAEYLANIENLDRAVGKLLDFMRAQGLLKNTLILFSSDNGSYRQASNGELRAVKSYLYEGGIRVPGIIYWEGLSQKGATISEPAGFVDIMPTICDLLDTSPPDGQDGTSLMPLLQGEPLERENPLYWFFYRTSPEIALRKGNHVVLGKDSDTIPRTHRFSAADMSYIKSMSLADYELYDLSKDTGQINNIFDKHPKGTAYERMIDNKLREIQEEGYFWRQLPKAEGVKKVKTEWVKY